MNITKENVDALNAVIKVDIVAEDYQATVTKQLEDYRKKANIPGFRKIHTIYLTYVYRKSQVINSKIRAG